ncbi:MAG: hypothetical protein K2J02_00910 [Malacoplasma sp.]|nr:hypothetical protein [Malacoplasma sp.]MDE6893921.1 hypothetical protein [Malacoplasma sp.]MDE7075530.1 hypothetical protein [Malacoplasma sp.]
MSKKIYKDGLVNWNECIYLYRFDKTLFLKNVLNELYFNLISKTAIKLITKKFKFVESEDLIQMGYYKFWELIENYKFHKSDAIPWLYYSVYNFFRNEIRKLEKSKNPMNFLVVREKNFKENMNLVCYNKIFNTVKEFEYGVQKSESVLFKKIYKLKKEGYTYESMSKMLNMSYHKIRGCWDYYRKKIIIEYGIEKF